MMAMTLSRPSPIASEPLQLVALPDPEPGPVEVLIRVEVCGVCRTDLHVVDGEPPPHRPGVIPGHEVEGRVERRGPGAGRFQINSPRVLHLS